MQFRKNYQYCSNGCEKIMKTVRVGLIGTGVIASLHARAYQEIADAQLSAICDCDQEQLQKRAAAWQVTKTYQNYHDLLDDPEIDAVEVLTPEKFHKEMAIAAIRAGKHVSVQKPMAADLQETREMQAVAEKSKTVARVYENFRFYPAIRRAKELIDAGEIGDPLSIRFKLTNGIGGKGEFAHKKSETWDRRMSMDKSGSGAVTFDHGWHLYSLARYFMGDIESVFAYIGRRKDENGYIWDSPAMITWQYAGQSRFGVWEQVWGDELVIKTNYYAGEDRMEITGSKGLIWVTKCTAEFWDIPSLILYRDGQIRSFHDLDTDWQASFTNCTKNFISSITGQAATELTFAESVQVQKIALAVRLSSSEQRLVKISEIS